MRVMVLGHRGMLGHVVARWLGRNHDVLTTEARYDGSPQDDLIGAVVSSRADWIINCIARIDQKTASPSELYLANAILPLHLKLALAPEQKMIHASTDGVFSGNRGNYRSSETPDPVDFYGLSKALGEAVAERDRCYVIRTSIVGPASQRLGGLMSWLLQQQGTINGYTNHRWNGITTLEWAKLCEQIIDGGLRPPAPLFHTGSPRVISKHELLSLMVEIWRRNVEICPVEAPRACNRSLVADVARGDIRTQLEELKELFP